MKKTYTAEDIFYLMDTLGSYYHLKYESYPEIADKIRDSDRVLKSHGFMDAIDHIREYLDIPKVFIKPEITYPEMKQKPLELDLLKVEEIANKFDLTPKVAMDVFNEIYNVANPLIITDRFLPPWSNKKIVDLNSYTTIQIGIVGVGDPVERRNELRLRVIRSNSPMTEHTIVLPNPKSE